MFTWLISQPSVLGPVASTACPPPGHVPVCKGPKYSSLTGGGAVVTVKDTADGRTPTTHLPPPTLHTTPFPPLGGAQQPRLSPTPPTSHQLQGEFGQRLEEMALLVRLWWLRSVTSQLVGASSGVHPAYRLDTTNHTQPGYLNLASILQPLNANLHQFVVTKHSCHSCQKLSVVTVAEAGYDSCRCSCGPVTCLA